MGFGGVECAFFSPPAPFVTRESTRSSRDRVSSCRRRVSRRTASSDSRVCHFLFALAFGRLRSTCAREPLLVEAGCTPGSSSCAPSERVLRPWFTLKTVAAVLSVGFQARVEHRTPFGRWNQTVTRRLTMPLEPIWGASATTGPHTKRMGGRQGAWGGPSEKTRTNDPNLSPK